MFVKLMFVKLMFVKLMFVKLMFVKLMFVTYVLDLEPHGYFRDTSPSEYAAQYVQEPTFRTQEQAYCGR